MLGLGDFNVSLVFILTLLSAVLCVVYGLLNWNRGGLDDDKIVQEEQQWEKEEHEIEENL